MIKKATYRTPDPCALRADASFARGFVARLPTGGFAENAQWKICDAPARGCIGGRRKAVFTSSDHCAGCGSQLRVLKNQNRSA